MKRILIFTTLLLMTFLTALNAQDKIALTLKTSGDVALKHSKETAFKPKLAIGTPLFSEDHIKTGKDGLAVLVFLDDKSQIKIRENSEMIIRGKRGNEAISKNISMSFGTLKAEVSPQRKGDFVIATPTSVLEYVSTQWAPKRSWNSRPSAEGPK